MGEGEVGSAVAGICVGGLGKADRIAEAIVYWTNGRQIFNFVVYCNITLRRQPWGDEGEV